MSTAQAVIDRLYAAATDLRGGLELVWRRAPAAPADPATTHADPGWPVWRGYEPAILKPGQPNWFCAEVVLPAERCDVALAGTRALLFIRGWSPFTLWVDGVEQFAEDHAWHATGPIADPLAAPIRPGHVLRLWLKVEPTAEAVGVDPVGIDVVPEACLDFGVQVEALGAELTLAAHLAADDAERALVARGAAAIDFAAIGAGRWDAVLASGTAMEAILAPLSPRAKKLTVHLLGHSHIDMDWMWTWEDTLHCIRRDYRAAADLLTDHPEVTYLASQIPTYAAVQEHDPAVFAQVQHLIDAGRWENGATTWVEGDLGMADGEAIARQIRHARAWGREHLGGEARVMWQPDAFAHPGNMPQIARLAGCDSYFHMRVGQLNKVGGIGHSTHTWEGIDGSTITAFSCPYCCGLEPRWTVLNLTDLMDLGQTQVLRTWGVGDHGGGLPRLFLRQLTTWRHRPLIPSIAFSTTSQALAAVRASGDVPPRTRGETRMQFEGCLTTHATVKRENRACESAALAAEAFAARAGLDRRTALRAAWLPALFNQFHDIFDGSAVHEVYPQVTARAESSLAASRAVAAEALDRLAPTAADGDHLTLVNPLGFSRSEPVICDLPTMVRSLIGGDGRAIPVQRLADGRASFLAADVPTFGSRSWRHSDQAVDAPAISASQDGERITVTGCCAKLEIDRRSGAVSSLVAHDRELVAAGLPYPPAKREELSFNLFQLLDEAWNNMAAWVVGGVLREENLLRGASVELIEAGPVCARIRVRHAFRASRLIEILTVWRDHPRIDLDLDLDWREPGNQTVGVPHLKLAFAASLDRPRLRTEGPYCVRTLPADGHDQPTQRWADLSGAGAGFTVFNDGLHACDALGGRLRISLVRNACLPDPESDNGRHQWRLAVQPHGGDRAAADLWRDGMAFNRSLIARRTAGPVAQPAQLTIADAPGVVCTALDRSEDGEALIVRLFEADGAAATARVSLGTAFPAGTALVDLRDLPTGEGLPLNAGSATCVFRPYEIKTLRVPLAGFRWA
jgi:alpha-mannosidase